MKILVASSSLISCPVIESIRTNEKLLFQGVITNPDKATGRGQIVSSNTFSQWCQLKGIESFKPSSNDQLEALLSEIQPDVVLTIAYGKLLSKDLLNLPRFGWLNIHFSALPKWRGAAPVQWAILSGDKSIGLTIFKLDQGMDTGPIYDAAEFALPADATTGSTLEFLSLKAAELIYSTLDKISTGIPPSSQPEKSASLARKFTKADGLIDWNQTSDQILRKFRALYENPGVWSKFGEDRVKINNMSLLSTDLPLKPGVGVSQGEKLIIGTGDSAIEIENLTPAGRSAMSGSEFIRGQANRTELYFG